MIDDFQQEMIFTSILLHIKFDKVFKYDLIKIWRLECFVCLKLVLNVVYNTLLHCWYTTKNNKFLMKIFATKMLSYLTFAMAKVKIKLPSHSFPNSHGCIQALLRHTESYPDMFRILCNPYLFNHAIIRTLAYLELKVSSKACQTCEMIRFIQSLGLDKTVYSSIFKGI